MTMKKMMRVGLLAMIALLAGVCQTLAQTQTQTQTFSAYVYGLSAISSLDGTEKVFALKAGMPGTFTPSLLSSMPSTLTNKTFNCASNTCTVRLGYDVTGTLQAGNFPALMGDVTTIAGSLSTTIANNAVTNAKLAPAGAGTIKGNPTATNPANVQDFTIQGLTNNSSPSSTLDYLIIYNHSTGTLQSVTATQLLSTVGVTSLNMLTGAVSVVAGTGISVTASSPNVTVALSAARQTLPTIQRFLSGSGTYTTPANVLWIEVNLCGGGGGGSAGGSGATSGGAGVATTFGTSLLTANGGAGGAIGPGGAGGTTSVAAGPIIVASMSGNSGQTTGLTNATTAAYAPGGNGAPGPFGGSGAGGVTAGGSSAVANSCAGGGGGGSGNMTSVSGGGGGGEGGLIDVIIYSPTASYAYAVGSGGPGGTSGTGTSGTGGSGYITVTEHYGS